MTVAKLLLLGKFELRLASGQALDSLGQKDQALVAVLVLQPGMSQTREKLAGLLWSDRGQQQARDSLKHSLSRLRDAFQAVLPQPIVADRQSAWLDSSALTVDVADLERLLDEGSTEALVKVMAIYRGDLLDGIRVRDPVFEDWLQLERQRLRQRYEEGLTSLLAQSMASGASGRADEVARKLISSDPLREAAYRALMQLHADRGQTVQAVKLYEDLSDRLQRELGVKPELGTTELHESIRHRRTLPRLQAAGNSDSKPAAQHEQSPRELDLPSKPSIAVMSFQNLSGDPEQDYFADGIVEEIITALSRMKWLFVVARNSSFTYKGRSIDVKQIGRELGVRYVLEGSLRKSSKKIRITGQLIDATTGTHLWAERFDGNLDDIFDLQDLVTARVVGAISPTLEQAEIERSRRKPTESLNAYDYYLRGLAAMYLFTREGNSQALSCFGRATECDPAFAAAYGMAARCHTQRKIGRWMDDPEKEDAEAERLARRAIELGPNDAVALFSAGLALCDCANDFTGANAVIERAIALNPNLAHAWLYSSWVKSSLGKPDISIEHAAHAMRLSPQDPLYFSMQCATALAHFIAGRYAEALSWSNTALLEHRNFLLPLCISASSAAHAGVIAEARKTMAHLRRTAPELSISNFKHVMTYLHGDDYNRWLEGLRKAGLPE